MMRFAIPTVFAAVAALVVGAVIASAGWGFPWVILVMVGVVLALGVVALVVAMVWPPAHRQPTGHPVGF